jgi:hypothetical protein
MFGFLILMSPLFHLKMSFRYLGGSRWLHHQKENDKQPIWINCVAELTFHVWQTIIHPKRITISHD